MNSSILFAAALASTLAVSSPVAKRTFYSSNDFRVINFVYGCTVTCDWSFGVSNSYDNPPTQPAFTQVVYCSGSKGTNTAFEPVTCESISSTQQVLAYVDGDNQLQIQYQVNIPNDADGQTGAIYYFEGNRSVAAATGYHATPSKFLVPVARAFAIA